jgi:cation:H+ antiporter
MFNLITLIFIFIVSLIALIKASDYFTDAAEKLGLLFKIPPFIVGVTIVSIGTSLPELVSSLFAVYQGSTEIVAGNAIGSNIANIFLVLGVAVIVSKKLKLNYEIISVDLPILMGSSLLLAFMILDGKLSMIEGLLLLAMFFVYIKYTLSVQNSFLKESREKEIKKEIKDEIDFHRKRKNDVLKAFGVLFFCSIFIYFGAKYTIWSVIEISQFLNIGKEIIAVTAIALGTSFPELIVSITTATKGKPEMAIGNVLGSNIFNALIVMGIPSLFKTLIVPSSLIIFGLPLMIVATFLFSLMTQDKVLTKWEGYLLVIFYIFFVLKTVGLF